MSIILDCFGTMVLFVSPTAVELSVWIGLRGCNHCMSEGFPVGNHFPGSNKDYSKLTLSSQGHDKLDDGYDC
jgi:hypothetical protein